MTENNPFELIDKAITDVINNLGYDYLLNKPLIKIRDIIPKDYSESISSFITIFNKIVKIMDIKNSRVSIIDPKEKWNEKSIHVCIDYEPRNTNQYYDTCFYLSELKDPVSLVTQITFELSDFIQFNYSKAYNNINSIVEIFDTDYYSEIASVYFGFSLFYSARTENQKEFLDNIQKFRLSNDLLGYTISKWSMFHNYKYHDSLLEAMNSDLKKYYINYLKDR